MTKSTKTCLALVLVLPAIILALEPPVPVSPVPGTKGRERQVELVVDCPIEVDVFHFLVYDDYDNGVPVAEFYTPCCSWLAPVLTRSNQLPDEFDPGRYFWTCRVGLDGTWSDFYEPYWDFEVTKDEPPADGPGRPGVRPPPVPPLPPVPVSPPAGTKGRDRQVDLVVNCPIEVDMFHFQVYDDGDKGVPLVEFYTPGYGWLAPLVTGASQLPEEFDPGKYFWTCRASLGGTWSEFFEPYWDFEVTKDEPPADGPGRPGVRPPPLPPIPVAPEPGSKMREPIITLITEAPAQAELFHFRVYGPEERAGAPEPVWEAYVQEPFWTIPMMLPVLTGLYQWSCRLHDGTAWSAWFEPSWTFEIEKLPEGHAACAAGTGRLPQIALSPNPCGPTGAQVRLNLTRPARVSVGIYSATGGLVRTLTCDRPAHAGTFSINWDGTDATGNKVGAGTYLCRVQADDTRQVVKLTKSR